MAPRTSAPPRTQSFTPFFNLLFALLALTLAGRGAPVGDNADEVLLVFLLVDDNREIVDELTGGGVCNPGVKLDAEPTTDVPKTPFADATVVGLTAGAFSAEGSGEFVFPRISDMVKRPENDIYGRLELLGSFAELAMAPI